MVERDDLPRGQLLDVRTERNGTAAVIELHGEMDLSSVAGAEAALDELDRDKTDTLGIDLRGLKFLDSSGLRFILAAAKVARESGWTFFLVRGSQQVQRVFGAAGLDGELTIVDEPGEAIRADS